MANKGRAPKLGPQEGIRTMKRPVSLPSLQKRGPKKRDPGRYRPADYRPGRAASVEDGVRKESPRDDEVPGDGTILPDAITELPQEPPEEEEKPPEAPKVEPPKKPDRKKDKGEKKKRDRLKIRESEEDKTEEELKK